LAAARADAGVPFDPLTDRVLPRPLVVKGVVGDGPREFSEEDGDGFVDGRRPIGLGGGGFLIVADMLRA